MITKIFDSKDVLDVVTLMVSDDIPVYVQGEPKPFSPIGIDVELRFNSLRQTGDDQVKREHDVVSNLLKSYQYGTRQFTVSFFVTADGLDDAVNVAEQIRRRCNQAYYKDLFREHCLTVFQIGDVVPLSSVTYDNREFTGAILDLQMTLHFKVLEDHSEDEVEVSVSGTTYTGTPWIETADIEGPV